MWERYINLLFSCLDTNMMVATEEQKTILAEAKTVQEKATKKAKDLEEKMKNASAVRERELKEAEKEITTVKKRMEASSKKAREMIQVFAVLRGNFPLWSIGVTYGPMSLVVFIWLAVVCSAKQLSLCLACWEFKHGRIVHTCHAISTIDFYHLFTSFSASLWLGITRLVESKTCWLHLLAHFSTAQDEM